MAKQESIIQLRGTIDGINFYIRKGKPIARKAGGGFNGDTIKKSPNMVRVRENGSEFGTCSSAKKLFNDCLKLYFGNRKDVSLHARMMRLFLDIKNCDVVSERGKRNVGIGLQTVEGKKMLTSFQYTTMFFPDLKIEFNGAFYELIFTKKDFDLLKFSKGATHLELCLGLLHIDFETHKATFIKGTPVLMTNVSSDVVVSLMPEEMSNFNGFEMVVLFYSYLQEVNGTFYFLKDADCFGMRVLEILD